MAHRRELCHMAWRGIEMSSFCSIDPHDMVAASNVGTLIKEAIVPLRRELLAISHNTGERIDGITIYVGGPSKTRSCES